MSKKHTAPQSLHEYLERTGSSQRELARAVKWNEASLSQFLQGKAGCTLAVALRLSAVTGVAVENIAKQPKMRAVRSYVKVA
jgi:plasmid maintenance system antidote protein VapI